MNKQDRINDRKNDYSLFDLLLLKINLNTVKFNSLI